MVLHHMILFRHNHNYSVANKSLRVRAGQSDKRCVNSYCCCKYLKCEAALISPYFYEIYMVLHQLVLHQSVLHHSVLHHAVLHRLVLHNSFYIRLKTTHLPSVLVHQIDKQNSGSVAVVTRFHQYRF